MMNTPEMASGDRWQKGQSIYQTSWYGDDDTERVKAWIKKQKYTSDMVAIKLVRTTNWIYVILKMDIEWPKKEK